MEASYSLFVSIQKLCSNLTDHTCYPTEKREIRACAERLFTSLADRHDQDWADHILDPQNADLTEKFINEIDENKNIRNLTGEQANHIISQFAKCHATAELTYDALSGCVSYGNFDVVLPRYVYRRLFKRTSPEQVVTMLMNYASLLPQGQQWAIPDGWFRHIQSEYGLDLIGFSSPINVQIDNVPFCSVFKNIDQPFGGVGNFFSLQWAEFLKDRTSFTLVLNPPFIESVMQRAVEHIDRMFEVADKLEICTIVFFNGPGWTDADFYISLSGHQYLRADRSLGKGSHYYVDCNRFKNNKISNVTSHLFALCNRSADFSNMTDGMQILRPKPRGVDRYDARPRHYSRSRRH